MSLRALPIALCLAGASLPSSALAGGYASVGLVISVSPGPWFPLGVGLELEGGGGPGPQIGGFMAFERRAGGGRTTLGARVGTEYHLGPTIGTGLTWRRKNGGPGAVLEAGVGIMSFYGATRLKVDTTLPFRRPVADDGLPRLGGPRPQHTTVSLSGGLNPILPFYLTRSRGVEGRPLREAGVAQLPEAVLLGEASEAARIWLDRARTEHASVPAFLQLAAELVALGAPRELVGRARRAARDEQGHALLCYAMAQQVSGRPVLVGATPNWSIRGGDRRTRLGRIAREALVDGIVGEGDAARRAEARRDSGRDELAVRVEHAIVVEESRHARLAEDVLCWAIREGGRLAA